MRGGGCGGAGKIQSPGSRHCPCPRPRWGGRASDSLLVEALGGSSQSCHCLPSFPYPPHQGRSRAPSSRGGPGFGEILGAPRRKNGHSQALDSRKRHPSPANFSEASPQSRNGTQSREQGLSAPCPLFLCSQTAVARQPAREAERRAAWVWLLQVHAPKPGTQVSSVLPFSRPATPQTTQAPLPQRRRCKELTHKN